MGQVGVQDKRGRNGEEVIRREPREVDSEEGDESGKMEERIKLDVPCFQPPKEGNMHCARNLRRDCHTHEKKNPDANAEADGKQTFSSFEAENPPFAI